MRAFALLVLLALSPACFASTGLEEGEPCNALPVCQEDYVEVDVCVGDTPCVEDTLCGTTILCALDVCPPGPACQDSELEVDFCDESSPSCRAFMYCGAPAYCESGATCAALPVCPAGDVEVESCEAEAACYSVRECGTTIYCAPRCEAESACRGAQSSVLDQGPGSCGDFDRAGRFGCFESPSCLDWYCLTACEGDDVEVASPAECFAGGECYESFSGTSTVWCTGYRDMCLAEPVCESYEEQIPLRAECPPQSQCRFVEECGVTIQCAELILDAG